jgi:hypothetical protein
MSRESPATGSHRKKRKISVDEGVGTLAYSRTFVAARCARRPRVETSSAEFLHVTWRSGQHDQRCGGESQSYRGCVAHVVVSTTMPRPAALPLTAGIIDRANKSGSGFEGGVDAWGSPG